MTYEDKIIEKRLRLTDRINKKFNIERPWFSFERCSIENEQAEFKKLFNNEDPVCRIVAWNAISLHEMPPKYDFTDDEYEFILRRLQADETAIDCARTNPNKDIITDRLVLKSPCDYFPDFSYNTASRSTFDVNKCESLRLYRKHLKEDGDFKIYTGLNPTKNNINRLELLRPFCFAVYEKESMNMVGIVGLCYHDEIGRTLPYNEERRMTHAQWYIFKPYRHKGYCKEAFTALAEQAFNHKLFEWREQLMECNYKKHYANIDLIRVYIRESNTASQALAKSCGFIRKYVERRYFVVEGEGLEDAVIMELEPHK